MATNADGNSNSSAVKYPKEKFQKVETAVQKLFEMDNSVDKETMQSAESKRKCQLKDKFCSSTSRSEKPSSPPPLYSEIPGTVPLSNATKDTPPPSYNDVIDPEASPPTYQSLFEQTRQAWINSLGFVDFVNIMILYLLASISLTVVLAVTTVVPVAMVLVGSKYFGQCPVEQSIPIHLIVGGAFGVLKSLMIFFMRNPSEQDQKRGRIVDCFLILWFFTGCVWTYRVYKPEYEDDSSPLYCNRTLYLFSFWLLTSPFIIVGLMITLVVCFVVLVIANYECQR